MLISAVSVCPDCGKETVYSIGSEQYQRDIPTADFLPNGYSTKNLQTVKKTKIKHNFRYSTLVNCMLYIVCVFQTHACGMGFTGQASFHRSSQFLRVVPSHVAACGRTQMGDSRRFHRLVASRLESGRRFFGEALEGGH